MRRLTLSPKRAEHWLRWLLLAAYGAFLLFVGLFIFTHVRRMVAASEVLPSFTGGNQPSPNVGYEEGTTLPTWTGTDRITILLMGIDEREQEEGPWRTDSMMVVTLDPVTMKAGVLSIPRDIWVEIPGYESGRINTAYFLGDLTDYPGGGPALAMETIRHNFAIPVDHYVVINFHAFVALVDEIGGIDIDVPETIDDPYYPDYNYGYDPLHIEAGHHHFDGEMALKYARTRHSGHGDFDRARRQQQVAMAILEKVKQPDVLAYLVARAPKLYETLQASVRTDLKLDQIIALGVLASKVEPEDIRFAVVDESCTLPYTTPDGAMVLVPIRERMREKRDYIFWLTDEGGEETAEAQVSVLNGTEQVGLAASTAQYLEENGIPVARYDNADRQDYADSLVIINRDHETTAEKILRLLGLPDSALVHGDNPAAEYDITVILGQDYARQLLSQP